MSRVVAIADMPSHLDREAAEVGRGGQDFNAGIMGEATADQPWQSRYMVRDCHHLRHGKEIGDGDGHVAPKVLLRHRLKQARAQNQRLYRPIRARRNMRSSSEK